mmetsp:Transcript_53142/g.159039  ORF Transcript_53142/g.159039 Transcript_53142/m.159039 type:complete len:203 (-) Transcript_53142:363-971(-)
MSHLPMPAPPTSGPYPFSFDFVAFESALLSMPRSDSVRLTVEIFATRSDFDLSPCSSTLPPLADSGPFADSFAPSLSDSEQSTDGSLALTLQLTSSSFSSLRSFPNVPVKAVASIIVIPCTLLPKPKASVAETFFLESQQFSSLSLFGSGIGIFASDVLTLPSVPASSPPEWTIPLDSEPPALISDRVGLLRPSPVPLTTAD